MEVEKSAALSATTTTTTTTQFSFLPPAPSAAPTATQGPLPPPPSTSCRSSITSTHATYQVTCPVCDTLLQVVLPAGVMQFACAKCPARFAVQPTPVSDALPSVGKMKRKKREKKDRPPRQLTPYNLFIKSELAKVKAEQGNLTHREAFRIASKRWATAATNPKFESGLPIPEDYDFGEESNRLLDGDNKHSGEGVLIDDDLEDEYDDDLEDDEEDDNNNDNNNNNSIINTNNKTRNEQEVEK